MPEMQPMSPGAAGMNPAVLDAATRFLDDDYALGCECADPALQIERWSESLAPSSGEPG